MIFVRIQPADRRPAHGPGNVVDAQIERRCSRLSSAAPPLPVERLQNVLASFACHRGSLPDRPAFITVGGIAVLGSVDDTISWRI